MRRVWAKVWGLWVRVVGVATGAGRRRNRGWWGVQVMCVVEQLGADNKGHVWLQGTCPL